MNLQAALDLTTRFAEKRLGDVNSVLLAGSVSRGEATAQSDFDIVALYNSLPEGAWREMQSFEGRDFEVFAHDLGTLAYFFSEIERPSGRPVLAAMVVDGVAAKQGSPEILAKARVLARNLIDAGPSPLDCEAINLRRYTITDLLQALSAPHSTLAMMSVGCTLYTTLADFVLRTSGKWSAGAKAIPLALADLDSSLPEAFEVAFQSLFVQSDPSLALALADRLLSSYGGRLRSGYKQTAPPSWRAKDDAQVSK